MIFVLSGLKLNDLALTAVGTKMSKFVDNSDRLSSYCDRFEKLVPMKGKKRHINYRLQFFNRILCP